MTLPPAPPSESIAMPSVGWTDHEGLFHRARWRSLAGHPPPSRVQLADAAMSANRAWRLIEDGSGLLWLGDYPGARHLLQALGRRFDARHGRPVRPAATLKEAFLAQRRAQALRARLLGGLLLPFDADHGVPLPRAPDLRAAGLQAHGPVGEPYVASLRELLGLVGAFEWRKKGVPVPALGGTIHPHHGVFSPVRGEYVGLVAETPLPAAAGAQGAFDIGTGTGVLALVLARRGLRVTATDLSPAALACAAENAQRLGLVQAITLRQADLFPEGRAGLVVCNPPWVPAAPSSALEAAVYDPGSAMLRGFLAGLPAHLAAGGEGWLILSDLAEHLGLRSRDDLLGWIAGAGLTVRGRIDTRPQHRRAADPHDALHAARSAEITSLWRLSAG